MSEESTSIEMARTNGLKTDRVRLAVIVPTFRRPQQVVETIRSIAAQTTPVPLAVVVIDNDDAGRQGAEAVAPMIRDGAPDGIVIIARQQGNCHAYNAGFATALEAFPALEWVAIIDDDEIAPADWLEKLVATAQTHNVDCVGAPQHPVFADTDRPAWQHHPVFRAHYGQTGPVDMLYSSGNVLISADLLRRMPRPHLDVIFNFTGGGDADFFRRAGAAGARYAWCAQAGVAETIPASRVSRDWITRRALRNGQLSALIEHRQRAGQPLGAWRTRAKSLALLAVAPLRMVPLLMREKALLNALYPVHIALGRIASEFGYANEQYRNPQD